MRKKLRKREEIQVKREDKSRSKKKREIATE
jgi:hypothetical protein